MGSGPGRIWSAIARCRSRGAMPEAVAAVEIALHDLAAKASNRPVWAVLGADEAKSVVCNATLPAANPTATRAIAESGPRKGSAPSS